MTRWKAIKRACYAALTAAIALAWWIVKQIPAQPQSAHDQTAIANIVHAHPFLVIAPGLIWLVFFGGLWLWAHARECFQTTAGKTRLFCRAKDLEFSNFDLTGFHTYYHEKKISTRHGRSFKQRSACSSLVNQPAVRHVWPTS